MLDLEGIVARWKCHAEAASIENHPTVWVAHYGTSEQSLFDRILNGPSERSDELLGALAAHRPESVGAAVLLLASPWQSVAEIHETIIVVDIDRMLNVTHFYDLGRSQRSTDWKVPYGMDDGGRFTFDVAARSPSAVWRECQIIWENRSYAKGKHRFDEAFAAALAMGEQLL